MLFYPPKFLVGEYFYLQQAATQDDIAIFMPNSVNHAQDLMPV